MNAADLTDYAQHVRAAEITKMALAEIGFQVEIHPTNPDKFRPINDCPPCPVLYKARKLACESIGLLDVPLLPWDEWHERRALKGWCDCGLPERANQ